MATVKEAKEKLIAMLKQLENYDENNKFVMEIDDNCGGAYSSNLDEFNIRATLSGVVEMSNF